MPTFDQWYNDHSLDNQEELTLMSEILEWARHNINEDVYEEGEADISEIPYSSVENRAMFRPQLAFLGNMDVLRDDYDGTDEMTLSQWLRTNNAERINALQELTVQGHGTFYRFGWSEGDPDNQWAELEFTASNYWFSPQDSDNIARELEDYEPDEAPENERDEEEESSEEEEESSEEEGNLSDTSSEEEVQDITPRSAIRSWWEDVGESLNETVVRVARRVVEGREDGGRGVPQWVRDQREFPLITESYKNNVRKILWKAAVRALYRFNNDNEDWFTDRGYSIVGRMDTSEINYDFWRNYMENFDSPYSLLFYDNDGDEPHEETDALWEKISLWFSNSYLDDLNEGIVGGLADNDEVEMLLTQRLMGILEEERQSSDEEESDEEPDEEPREGRRLVWTDQNPPSGGWNAPIPEPQEEAPDEDEELMRRLNRPSIRAVPAVARPPLSEQMDEMERMLNELGARRATTRGEGRQTNRDAERAARTARNLAYFNAEAREGR
tara:strand:+ start:858 stop:2354 length:1497 start_codon:yes stop_codon:yes gene_type:complete